MKIRSLLFAAAFAAGVALLTTSISAQGTGSGSGSGSGSGAGTDSGMMMGRRGMGMGMMGGCQMMGGMMQGMGGMGGNMSAHSEGRVAFLKAELGITDAQQSAWTAYAEALRKNLSNMQGMHQSMMKAVDAKSAVERLDAHIAGMEGRLASLKEIKTPLAALYAVLSDEQKKKADDLITGMGCMM